MTHNNHRHYTSKNQPITAAFDHSDIKIDVIYPVLLKMQNMALPSYVVELQPSTIQSQ